MSDSPFTKAEADYLVDEPKFIKAVPQPKPLNKERSSGVEVVSSVFRKCDPTKPIPGLVIQARWHRAPPGTKQPTPSAALAWYTRRIRGINYELRHGNPDGTFVRGWHEHIWSPQEEDKRVIPARPEPKTCTMLGLLKWGLEKWNIEVQQEQAAFDDFGY